MDRSAVQRFLDDHGPHLKRFLGLHDWQITFRPAELDSGTAGECTPKQEYKIATIELNYPVFDDDDFLLDTLAHEMMHCCISPIHAGWYYCNEFTDNELGGRQLDRVFRVAIETAMLNLDWIWRTHLRDRYLEQYTGG